MTTASPPTLPELEARVRSLEFYTTYRSQSQLEDIITEAYDWAGYSTTLTVITRILGTGLDELCRATGEEGLLRRFGVDGGRASRCSTSGALPSGRLANYLYLNHQTAVPEIYGRLQFEIDKRHEA